jgi:DamX protein
MTDNAATLTDLNNDVFDNAFDILPLITKERTQKFELLLHFIPNLKQHLIVSGAHGIGKTLLLDMLYDIDSDAWQCCFVQGSGELSFETIEAQLTKSMIRNKHESLARAFQDAQDKHKKIVLIVDDAGLLVSGLITTLVEYATSNPVLKLILSFTPETRQKYRKTDRVLDNFYLIDIPRLNQEQSAYFLQHLATKPRTYGNLEKIEDKLLAKIYHDTQGIPARLIADFTKLSRDTQNDHTKWVAIFAGLLVLAVGINQGIHYFRQAPEQENTTNTIDEAKNETKVTDQSQETTIPLDNEKNTVANESSVNKDAEIVPNSTEKTSESSVVETKAESTSNTSITEVKSETKVDNDQLTPTADNPDKKPETAENSTVALEPQVSKEAISPVIETIQEPTAPAINQTVAPVVLSPKATTAPTIAFPKVEPAKGTKIQALPDKIPVASIALTAPHVETSESEHNEIDVRKIESKMVEKIADLKVADKKEEKKSDDKKVKPAKIEQVKKMPEAPPSVIEEAVVSNETAFPTPTPTNIVTPKAPTSPTHPVLGRYTLQLITLSSDAAISEFLKKHPTLMTSYHVVKYEKNGQTRFSIMYGNFANAQEALAARGNLATEFAAALPRKFNSAP